MPKHYQSDPDPKIPPKTTDNFTKKKVFETNEKDKKKTKKGSKKKSRQKY